MTPFVSVLAVILVVGGAAFLAGATWATVDVLLRIDDVDLDDDLAPSNVRVVHPWQYE